MKINSLLVICVLIIFNSCSQFLDVKSDAKLLVPSSLEDAQALLDDVLRMVELTVPARGEDIGDDYFISENIYNSFSYDQRSFYKWDYPEYFGIGNDWSAAYSPIYNANLALEIINKIERNSENIASWNNVKGSALFYRAFYFFKLLVIYSPAFDTLTAESDLGIVLRLNTDFNILSTRASVKQCYDRILMDLFDALEYLPDYPQHVTRPSKGAVYGLLSNIYHYRREYEESLKYANLALSLNDNLIDLNGDEDLGNINSNSTPFLKYNKETIFYAELGNGVVLLLPYAFIDSNLVQYYSDVDLRIRAYFRSSGTEKLFKGNLTGVNARLFGGISTSELYLNKAESLALLNQARESILTLNKLLEKRYVFGSILLNPDSNDSNTALRIVRKERRKELLFRGIRLADLKRYNKEGENIFINREINGTRYVLEPNSQKYNLPLPSDLIKYTGMKQN